jgi:cyclopropane fatty-acyl-phospholipid synthase-like methyltransferase
MPNTIETSSSWESFWKDNPTGFNDTMAKSTLFFAQRLNQMFPISNHDYILDIGCGPGFLITYLKDKCELAYGTDISEKYIEICKKEFAAYGNIDFNITKPYDYEAYDKIIIENQINRVILLSVLQYYKNTDEVRNLIENFKKTAQQQPFSCLLADIIPTQHSTFGDIFSIIKHAFKNGYTLKFMKFLVYAMFSDYRRIKKNGFLQIEENFFTTLAQELNINLKIIKNITMHSGRYSVLIDFK